MSPKEFTGISDQIEGWEDIHPRHTAGDEYRVLSLRNETMTAYRVDIADLSCNCPDKRFNKDDHNICAHIATALHSAPERIDVEDHAMGTLIELFRAGHAGALTASSDSQGETSMSTSDAMSDGPETVQDDAARQQGPTAEEGVEIVHDWLSTAVTEMEHVTVSITTHASVNGIKVDANNFDMTDAGFESFKGVVKSLDVAVPHVGFGDQTCNTCGENDGEYYYHIPANDLSEVPQ